MPPGGALALPMGRKRLNLSLALCLGLLVGCSTPPDGVQEDAVTRMMRAHGVTDFARVEHLHFTFHVERDGKLATQRGWVWNPQTGVVTRVMNGNRVSYDRDEMSATDAEIDKQFINDSFWLLPPLHLSWAGDDVTLSETGKASLPIGEGEATKIIAAYAPGGGGYTPGDVYELYVDAEGLIRAWHFRRGGAEKPTLTTTFSDYESAGPLKIATEHRNADGSFRLHFTGVKAQVMQRSPGAAGGRY